MKLSSSPRSTSSAIGAPASPSTFAKFQAGVRATLGPVLLAMTTASCGGLQFDQQRDGANAGTEDMATTNDLVMSSVDLGTPQADMYGQVTPDMLMPLPPDLTLPGLSIDLDADQVPDDIDNCPPDPNCEATNSCDDTFNSEQKDSDGDKKGDICDCTPDVSDKNAPRCEPSLVRTLDMSRPAAFDMGITDAALMDGAANDLNLSDLSQNPDLNNPDAALVPDIAITDAGVADAADASQVVDLGAGN